MTVNWPAWEGATACSSGPQPGVQAFMRWAIEEYGERGAYNLGIYNCRTVRGGSTTSLHGEGRAADIGFPVGDPDGDDLLRRLLKAPGRLGIQCIIYERTIYSAKNPAGAYYGGVAPHYDHLHIEFTWEAAAQLTYTTVKNVLVPPVRRPGTRDLRLGMRGPDVRWLQNRLNLEIDGAFGPVTEKAVRKFEAGQKSIYPRMRVDGVVVKITWRALGVTPKY